MENTNLLALLRRWWLWLLCGAVVGGAAGALAGSAATPKYSAEVKLLVGPISADFDDTLRASGQLARTYAELAVSRPVLAFAIGKTGALATPTALQESDAVKAQSNDVTRILSIVVEYGDAATAAQLANAIAGRVGALAALTPPEKTASIEQFLDQPEISRLSRDDRRAVRTAARRSLGGSLSGQVAIIEPAQKSSTPISPRKKLIIVLAAFMGMLVVTMLIVLRESSLQDISDERSLALLEQTPFLGTIEVPVPRRASATLAVEAGHDATIEAYRSVAARLGFFDNRPPVQSLLVVDTTDGRRSGVLAANLATVLADTQRRVLLVDANDVSGNATSTLGLDGRPGYGELTTSVQDSGHDEDLELSRIDRFPTLSVLPRGTTPVTQRLDEDYGQHLLTRLSDEADIVILSGAPVHLSTGALLWGRVADGTLLVVDAGRTSHERVREAIASLSSVDAELVGTVLARPRRRRGTSPPRDGSSPAIENPERTVQDVVKR